MSERKYWLIIGNVPNEKTCKLLENNDLAVMLQETPNGEETTLFCYVEQIKKDGSGAIIFGLDASTDPETPNPRYDQETIEKCKQIQKIHNEENIIQLTKTELTYIYWPNKTWKKTEQK